MKTEYFRTITEVNESDIELMKKDPEKFWEGVDAIGDRAFAGLQRLKEIVIPSTVKIIGNQAFRGCTNLERVVVLGEVKEIGYETFFACKSLRTVNYGKKEMTTIGNSAFAYCEKLEDFDFTNVQNIGDYAFERSGIKIFKPSVKLDRMGTQAFEGCKFLEEAYIPASLRVVEGATFQNCENLKELHFAAENGTRAIGYYAFFDCKSLTNVDLPKSLEVLGDSAFGRCANLKRVDIPSTLNCFGKSVFCDCPKLDLITIPPKALEGKGETL